MRRSSSIRLVPRCDSEPTPSSAHRGGSTIFWERVDTRPELHWSPKSRTIGMFGRCATGRKRAVINILGRVGELDEAERSLRAVREGSGASLVILGAAGMGKTTFLAELRRKAEDDEFRVRHARGELLERGFPWGVVRRLFERAGGKRTGAAELARIPLQGSEVDGSLFASLHGLYWLAVELAQEQPLALFVDDAHWADMLSMRWLAYLAARIGEDPVLLAIAARPEPCEDDEGAWPSLMSNGHVPRGPLPVGVRRGRKPGRGGPRRGSRSCVRGAMSSADRGQSTATC